MRATRTRRLALAILCAAAVASARADTSAEVYRKIGIDAAKVLSGTTLTAQVLPGQTKQVVALTTYFTGKGDRPDAVNVRLDVLERHGNALESVWTRDIGAERGLVAGGDLQLVDLDLDGVNEIIVSYDSYADPLIEQRLGEVTLYDPEAGFQTAWSMPVAYDATRAARSLPEERRDRFERQIDIPATLRTRGRTLFVQKKVLAVAGERLTEPKTVQETFPLRASD
jgi:hypothetical protein